MKLLEKFESVAHQRRLADNTIDAYRSWIQQFLRFSASAHGQWKRPEELGTADVEGFLNDLVSRRRLSASSQNQALNALVFLYSQVHDAVPENHLGKFALLRSTRPKRVPTVLSTLEVKRVIEAIPADHISRLITELMYGTGMRVGEVCTLRLRDIDVDRAQIIIRSGKGDKDRIVMLPASLRQRLIEQAAAVEGRWQKDVRHGGGFAPVPDPLEHKRPRAGRELPWQFLFPSTVLRRDQAGRGVRWHTDPSVLDRVVYRAAQAAGVLQRVTFHTFRQLRRLDPPQSLP